MGRMPRLVELGKKDRRLGEPSEVSWEEIEALELDPRVELIRQLIPLGLAEVGRMLEEEVEQLAWRRHARKTEDDRHYRHGHNPVSVRLGGQRHPVRVPRVRGPAGESRLAAYEQLHGSPGEMDEGLFRKVLLGISCRDYEAAVEAVPGAIGLSKSTVSREFKRATAAKLKEFQGRDLSGYDVVAFVLDGKSFAEDEMVVALVVTSKGDKVFLGFVQTDTENAVVIRSFLRSLKDRGIDLSAGALVVIDGARGLRSGVLAVFKGQVLIQRCQWHKRENVISYLPRAEQKGWRQRLQRAYQRPTYEEAVQDLEALRQELAGVNQSAAASLDEGFEEDPHPPPVGSLPPGRPVAQDHQRARVRERPGRATLRTRRPLEELEPEAPMARHCAPGDRASATEVARVPTPPAPQGRDPEGPRDHPSREQCASSTARRFTSSSGRRARNPVVARRSGDINRRRRPPARARASTSARSIWVRSAVRRSAVIPARRARSTWSAMRETSGLTTSVSPGSSKAGTW